MPPVPPSFYAAGGHPECVYGQPTTRPGAIVAYNPFSGQAVYIISAPAGAWLPGPAPNPGAAWAAAKAAQCLYSQQCQPGSGDSGGSGGSGGGGGYQTGTCPVCPVCSKPGCDCACFKKCQEQDPKPKVKWYVYKRTDGTCYVAEQTEPTEIEGDELQGEYTDETEAILVAQQCKKAKPPKPVPEAPVTPQAGGGVWCSTEVCNSIDATLGVVTIPELAAQPWIYSALLNGANYDPDSDQSLQGSPFLVRLVIGTFKGVAGSIAVSIGSFLRGMFCPSSGQSPAFFSINLYRTVVGFLRIFIGPVADDLEIEPGYSSHYLCPQRIPTSAEADAAYLSKSIDTGLWSCWVRANNDCDEPRLKIIDSKRSRLGVGELVALFMRGEIDHPTYYDSMRQLGFLYEQQADQYLTLANQIPPVSELVRMMVRDVADEGLVTKFGMDTDFGKKWQGQLKEWGKNQGVGDLFAKYEWRAHWSIPAPGQLYDMYHRLRGLDPADPNYVDLSTIETALEQQDILPYWIGKFIAISFRPLTRIDAGRAYELSAIDETRLKRSFTDLGYNDEDADTMVKFKKRQLGVRMRTLPPVSLYKKGLIPRNTAQGMLAADGYDAALITSALDYAQKLAAASTTAACVKSLKKRYMLGEVTQAQLAGELVGLNMDAFQANATAQAWQCERSARGKLASVAILCKWFKQNLINQGDYVTRLSNLGWHAAEIANHIQVCKNEIDAEKLKQQLAEQKQQEQAAKQAAALAAKLAREQQQQAEKLARLALKEAKLTRRQFQRITEAAKYMVKAGVLDFATAYNQIISAINTGLVVYQLDGQAAIDAALKAAQSLTAKNFADYPMLAEQAEKAEWLSFQAAVIDGSEML
ncbi:MAG TPA: hypothetical protein VFH56_16350 [Acidimicrobiales bacterium]|nr:hypothetical protein [Acidimicrobiales bacterium]